MNIALILVPGLISLVGTIVLLRLKGLSADVPNQRSSHSVVTPRGGGLAILLALLGSYAVFMPKSYLLPLIVAVSGYAVVGALEDRIGLQKRIRLGLEFAFATYLAVSGWRWADVSFGNYSVEFTFYVSCALTVIWLVWVSNLYNFMDGINGIATLEALTLCGFFGAAFYVVGDIDGLTLIYMTATALLVFLPFNFPVARIFMGDVGSLPLGLLFGALSLRLHQLKPDFSLLLASVVMLPFFYDATITMIMRAFRRENIFQAHRSHFYQRMTTLDQGRHVRTAFFYASQSVIFCALGWNVSFEKLPRFLSISLIGMSAAFLFLIWFLIYQQTEGQSRKK